MLLLTHNAYWFQGHPSLWGREEIRAHPRIVGSLIRLYRELAPEVICLQEVPRSKEARELAKVLGMSAIFASGGLRRGYGGAIFWRDEAGAVVEDLTHAPVSGAGAFERICLRWTGRWQGMPLTVVDVHLSSNRFAPEGRGEPVRLAELAALFATGPAPDVVAGDFNAVPDSQVYEEMVERGYQDAGLGCDEHGRAASQRVDYIWVREDSPLSLRRFGVVTGDRFALEGGEGAALSDHHPVWADLACRKQTVPDL